MLLAVVFGWDFRFNGPFKGRPKPSGCHAMPSPTTRQALNSHSVSDTFLEGDRQLNGPTRTVGAAVWYLLVSTKLWRMIPVSAVLNDGEEKAQLMHMSFSVFHIHQPLSLVL